MCTRFSRRVRPPATGFIAPLCGAAVALTLMAGMPTAAQAAFSVCNYSKDMIRVALSHTPKDPPGVSTGGDLGTTTEGWWHVKPQECSKISDIDAANTWIYFRSHSASGTIEGSTLLCVSDKPFTISQRFKKPGDRCAAGQHLDRFQRLDADKKNWTVRVH